MLSWLFLFGAGISSADGFRSAWDHYRSCCIQPDGRVIDRSRQNVTTSEGEAYALFFALVQNDPALFSRLLSWTRNNLSLSPSHIFILVRPLLTDQPGTNPARRSGDFVRACPKSSGRHPKRRPLFPENRIDLASRFACRQKALRKLSEDVSGRPDRPKPSFQNTEKCRKGKRISSSVGNRLR